MFDLIKRVMDIIFSLLVIILLAPLFLIIMVVLRCSGEGEVFYRQKRIGLHNKPFDILKFATMLKNSPQLGTGTITVKNDPRVLPFGKFLRKTKINELPQVLNVLFGNMSIVGPRPLTNETFNYYPDNIKETVYLSKPGITGVGSIVFRDEEKLISKATIPPREYYKTVIAPYKGKLEMWYNTHKSLGLDVKLILLTVWTIVFPDNKFYKTVLKGLPEWTE
jgi:lipopolysaccharide/colanic/teichoic acid biosynthesis glycosyltransferase